MFTHLTPVKSYESDMKNSQNNAAVINLIEQTCIILYIKKNNKQNDFYDVFFSFFLSFSNKS